MAGGVDPGPRCRWRPPLPPRRPPVLSVIYFITETEYVYMCVIEDYTTKGDLRSLVNNVFGIPQESKQIDL